MKVILQQDIKGKGKKGQMIEISDGYARNYLFPRKIAVPATTDNVNTMKLQEKAKAAQIEREKAEAREIVKKLESSIIKIASKAGASGKLFGSVTNQEISDALKAQLDITVEKQKIVVAEPIKSFGSFEVKCRLGYEIVGTIHVMVTEAK